jgi:glycosyltransferase involved in cell wall biosynthesis
MNIVHITPYYAPAYAFGGVPRAVEGMARAQAAHGDSVTVITTDALTHNRRTDNTDEMLDGVRVLRARTLSLAVRGRYNLSTPLGIRPLASQALHAADVVHCHEFRTLENLLLMPMIPRSTRLVLSPHGTLPHGTGRSALKSVWDAVISPLLARRFHAVIGLTDAESTDIRAAWTRFGATPQVVSIPNGVRLPHLPNPAPFRIRWGLDAAPVILFMGRLHPRKGADVLARAFSSLPHDARLLIVGGDEGLGATLQQLAMADARIVLTGYLSGDDRLAALATADLFVLPAVGEGLPLAALEALAAGVPTIVSVGCNLPIVERDGAGLVVDVSEGALAAAIRALLDDPTRRAAMGSAAAQLARTHFGWGSVIEQLAAVYRG